MKNKKTTLEQDLSKICKILDKQPIDNVKTLIKFMKEYLTMRKEIVRILLRDKKDGRKKKIR